MMLTAEPNPRKDGPEAKYLGQSNLILNYSARQTHTIDQLLYQDHKKGRSSVNDNIGVNALFKKHNS